jgi:hypothetical protein
MTLVGQVFTITVAMMALMQTTIGLEAFATYGSLDIPLCEKIK